MTRSLNIGLGINFQPGVQDGVINNRGVDLVHLIGIACVQCRMDDPNVGMIRDGKDRRRSPNCLACGGEGKVYRSPSVIKGIVTNIRQQRNVLDVGVAQPGDLVLSVTPNSISKCNIRHIAQDDKFIATWAQPLNEGQTLIRGAASLEDNNRLSPALNSKEDRLWYEPASSIWCEDENGKIFSENADFILGPGRIINWVNDLQVGTRYVIKYMAYFEWITWAPPQERIDRDNKDLGPMIFLRKRHVSFINDSVQITDDDRVSVISRINC